MSSRPYGNTAVTDSRTESVLSSSDGVLPDVHVLAGPFYYDVVIL